MPIASKLTSFFEKTLTLIGVALGVLIQFGMLLIIPVGLLYIIVKPAFGPNPAAEYYSMAVATGQFALVMGGIFCAIYIIATLAVKFKFVSSALKLIGYLFVALIAAGALAQCMSNDNQECRESRYITC
jgi:hypothetical protein